MSNLHKWDVPLFQVEPTHRTEAFGNPDHPFQICERIHLACAVYLPWLKKMCNIRSFPVAQLNFDVLNC